MPLAVTMGDPSGIGPDILLKCWKEIETLNLPDFFVVGNSEFLKKRADVLGYNVKIDIHDAGTNTVGNALKIVETGENVSGKPGVPSKADSLAAISAIEKAVDMVWNGQASAVVTSPVNKEALYKVGFEHPGHTEFLGALARERTGQEAIPVMMLAGPGLKTVPLTIHIPVNEVAKRLDANLIEAGIKTVSHDLKRWFGIESPRIAVAGLNPHAGENGTIGREDVGIVQPAIKKLQSEGLDVTGPLPADTMFHAAARSKYDVAVCMYHDQALIPAKMLAFDEAVNVTLGLPFIRTSPDHGTAYDIAGTGKANPSSFIAALRMADKMANAT